MALKEIKLEHDEGTPFTAIREGRVCALHNVQAIKTFIEDGSHSKCLMIYLELYCLSLSLEFSFLAQRIETRQHRHAARHNSHSKNFNICI